MRGLWFVAGVMYDCWRDFCYCLKEAAKLGWFR